MRRTSIENPGPRSDGRSYRLENPRTGEVHVSPDLVPLLRVAARMLPEAQMFDYVTIRVVSHSGADSFRGTW